MELINIPQQEYVPEYVLIKSAGYLKPPKIFRDRFPDWSNSPSPKASITETSSTITISYTWEKKDLPGEIQHDR